MYSATVEIHEVAIAYDAQALLAMLRDVEPEPPHPLSDGSEEWIHSIQPAYERTSVCFDPQNRVVVRDLDCHTVFLPEGESAEENHPSVHYVASCTYRGKRGKVYVYQGALTAPPYAVDRNIPEVPHAQRYVPEVAKTVSEILADLETGFLDELLAQYRQRFGDDEHAYRLHNLDSFAYYMAMVALYSKHQSQHFARQYSDEDREQALQRLIWLSSRVDCSFLKYAIKQSELANDIARLILDGEESSPLN
jgi:hypothetical protein